MTVIRPVEREDLKQVARLVAAGLPGWRRDAAVLAANLIDHPWSRQPHRSLVAADDSGVVVGSIGAQTRHMQFNGAKVDAVCVSHLVVDPLRRGGAAGALLVRELLSGEQDLTFTDSATQDVVRIWRAFGGHLDHTRSCDWMLVLRPSRWLRASLSLARSRGSRASRRDLLPVAAIPVHAAGRRLAARAFPPSDPEISSEEVSIGELAALLPSVEHGIRLRVDYDDECLRWVFAYLTRLTGEGVVVHRVVRRSGTPIGWYAYLHRPVVSRVLRVGASARDAPAVLTELVEDAYSRGTPTLSGRLEPHLHEAVRERYAAIGVAQRPLVHARDPKLLSTLSSSASLLAEMDLIDAEWW